jgi:hypothetical protein
LLDEHCSSLKQLFLGSFSPDFVEPHANLPMQKLFLYILAPTLLAGSTPKTHWIKRYKIRKKRSKETETEF